MTWTSTINKITYTEANFDGFAYANEDTGFPALIRDLVIHNQNVLRSSCTDTVTPSDYILDDVLALSTPEVNKFFEVGEVVQMNSLNFPGEFVYGNVLSYSTTTGALSITVVETNGTSSSSNWTLTAGMGRLGTKAADDAAAAALSESNAFTYAAAAQAEIGAPDYVGNANGVLSVNVGEDGVLWVQLGTNAFSSVSFIPTSEIGISVQAYDADLLDINDIDTNVQAWSAILDATTVAYNAAEQAVIQGLVEGRTEEAPEDGKQYVRIDATWSEVQTFWQIKTTTYTAVAGDHLLCDSSGGAFTITLPVSPAANDSVEFNDFTGSSLLNNITIARNGSDIMSLDEDFIVDTNYINFTLTYIDVSNGWVIT